MDDGMEHNDLPRLVWRPARPVNAKAPAVYRFIKWAFLVGWGGAITLHLLFVTGLSPTMTNALAGAVLSCVSVVFGWLSRRLTVNVENECAIAAAARELTLAIDGTAVQVDENDKGYAGVPDDVVKWVKPIQFVLLIFTLVCVTAAVCKWTFLVWAWAVIAYTSVLCSFVLFYRTRSVLNKVKWGP